MVDSGHKETEKLLKEMEKRISREYAKAVKEVQAKLDDYLKRFRLKDKKWREWVDKQEKTEKEYQQWKKQQIMVGERWATLKNQLAQDLHNANLIARSIIFGYMPEAYAINHNFATYEVEMGAKIDTSYTLYSRETVEKILRENPELLQPPGVQKKQEFAAFDAYKAGEGINLSEKQKKAFDKLIANGKDIRWQEGHIQSVTLQSILQGESIPNMAKRIAETMGETNHKATIRYARTAMTSVQNAGRDDAYKRAEKLGVEMVREWKAVHDMRTRHEHRQLDGQRRKVGEPFEVYGEKIMRPGDPSAPAHLIWNCRCGIGAVVKGLEPRARKRRSLDAIEGMSYEEWKASKVVRPKRITKQEEQGKAIAEQYRKKYRKG